MKRQKDVTPEYEPPGWKVSNMLLGKNRGQLLVTPDRMNQFSCSVMSNSLRPHGLQHARLPCPSPSPRACSNSRPFSQWCHPAISPSVAPFSSCLQSFPASGSFPMSQFFASGAQSTGASASVLPRNIQRWFPLGLTGFISFQSKGLSRVFSSTTVWKHQFFSKNAVRMSCYNTLLARKLKSS